MASFNTHLSFGVALGAAGVLAVVSFGLVPVEWGFCVLLALAAAVGAIMPDIDSDTGVPFHVTFGSLSLVAGGLALVYAYGKYPQDYRVLIGAPLGAMFFVWVILGFIFRKFTHHRGMAHSIPAALLAGLVVYSFAGLAAFDTWRSFLLGLALTGGYLLHLLLDEFYAATNFHGLPCVPNKAFGSALKLASRNFGITASVYLGLVSLVLGNYRGLSDSVAEMLHRLG